MLSVSIENRPLSIHDRHMDTQGQMKTVHSGNRNVIKSQSVQTETVKHTMVRLSYQCVDKP